MRNETVRSNVPAMTVCARRHDAPQTVGRVAELHYHEEMEFLPVRAGRFCCTVDGKDYFAAAGEVIFIDAGIPHSTYCDTPGTYVGLLQFRSGDFLDTEVARIIKYSVRLHGRSEEPVRILRSPEIYQTVCDILDETERKERAYEMFTKAGIYRLLGWLYRAGVLSDAEQLYKSREVQKILPALSYINSHYAEPLTLPQVAAMMGFNESYFCRIFKAATGATFTEYIGFVRVCKAEKLLARTQESILDISAAVGFSSVSYFNRVFRKFRNCSPKVYRSALHQNNI